MAETSNSENIKKYTPVQKVSAAIAALISAIGLGYLSKKVGADEAVMRQNEINEAIKIKSETSDLIAKQAEILEQKKLIDSGNTGLDVLALNSLSNEVYRYVKEDQLKTFESGAILSPDQIALLDIKDNSNYVVDGKIKLGVYADGEFRLINEITNYKDVNDSPQAVITWINKTVDELNPPNNGAKYKIAIINDGEHDCLIKNGSLDESHQAVLEKMDSGKENICLNEINLSSKILHSDNLYYPIAGLQPNEIATFSFIKEGDSFKPTVVSMLREKTDSYSKLVTIQNKVQVDR